MANVKVFNMQGAAVGEIALSDEVGGRKHGKRESIQHAGRRSR